MNKSVEVLERILKRFPEFDTQESMNGGDVINDLYEFWPEIKRAIIQDKTDQVELEKAHKDIVDFLESRRCIGKYTFNKQFGVTEVSIVAIKNFNDEIEIEGTQDFYGVDGILSDIVLPDARQMLKELQEGNYTFED